MAIIQSDAMVIAALRQRGDKLVLAREVKYWSLFSSRDGAAMYIHWLEDEGFEQIEIAEDDHPDGLDWQVTYTHQVVPRLENITAHTVAASTRAEVLGGHYDGWETSVETDVAG